MENLLITNTMRDCLDLSQKTFSSIVSQSVMRLQCISPQINCIGHSRLELWDYVYNLLNRVVLNVTTVACSNRLRLLNTPQTYDTIRTIG